MARLPGEVAMNAHDTDSGEPRGDGTVSGGADSRSRVVSDVLPLPPPRFSGTIGNTYEDSVADTITLPAAPDGAPNVLLILLDDVGFGQASTFGGPANTPVLQR